MIEIKTKRLIGRSDMHIEDKHIVYRQKNNAINILNLKEATGQETGFCFYDLNSPEIEICHVGISCTRNRFEVSYGTEEGYRHQGFMIEALNSFTHWVFEQTDKNEIWGLPNGPESQHILEKCGFAYWGPVENTNSSKWFVKRRNMHGQ